MARIILLFAFCLGTANSVVTYSETKSRLAMMEYGDENSPPVVPDFLTSAFTMTYIANIRGEVRQADPDTALPVYGMWSHPLLVKLAYIAFLTGNVLEPPKATSAHLNYTIWFVDECMNHSTAPVQCSAPYAMSKLHNIIYGDELLGVPYPPSDVAVGASMNSLEAAQVAGLKGIPMVGYTTGATPLSYKSNFPTYLRTRPPMRQEATNIALYLKHINNYTRVDTIVCDTFLYRSAIPEVAEVFAENGITDYFPVFVDKGPYKGLPAEYMVANGAEGGEELLERWTPKIAALKANNAHVHHSQLSNECPSYDIVHYLAYKGFVGAGHLWIGGDLNTEAYAVSYLTPIRYVYNPYNGISPFMFYKAWDAYVCIKMKEGKYINAMHDWLRTLESERNDLFEPWLLSHIPPGAFANVTDSYAPWWTTNGDKWRVFDAVWAILLAVNNLANKTGSTTFSSDALYEELVHTRFEGLSGFVRFRNSKSDIIGRGDRISDYDFFQYREPGSIPSTTCANDPTTGVFDQALRASQCVFPPPGQYVQVATFGEELSIVSNPIFSGGSTEAPPNLNKDCPAGESYDVVRGSCDKCPPGMYTDRKGQSSCNSCQPGFYAKEPGSALCSSCLQGTFSAIAESTSCLNCTAGRYTNTVQQSACFNCPLGQYADAGFENCLICPAGRYQDETGQGSCKLCLDIYPGTTSNNGARKDDECYCEQGTYYRPGGFGCTACDKGLNCPQGRATPTQMSGFYVDKVDEATKEYDVFECLTENWCPEGELSSCTGKRAGRSCAVVEGVRCPIWITMIAPLCLIFILYGIYRGTANSQYGKVSSWIMLAGNLGIALSAMQAVNVYVLLFDEIPEELHWLLNFAEIFMFKWQNVVPECSIGQSFTARLSLAIFPPITIVGICAFNWMITNLLAKTPAASRFVPPMNYASTWNCAGMLIQVMYIMQCKDAFSYFAGKANPCGKDTLQDFTDIIFGSEEHVAVGALLITGYLWLFYVIGTYVIFCYTTIFSARTNLGNRQFWLKWRFIFARWRPECRHWGCFLLLRNLAIALIPISIRTDQVYRVLAFVAIVGVHAMAEAHYSPWMTGMNNVFEIVVSGILIVMAIVGLAFTETATENQKNVASFVMMGCMGAVWASLILSFGYAVKWNGAKALKKRQESNIVVSNDVLQLCHAISETFDEADEAKQKWTSFSKNISSYDRHIFEAMGALLRGYGDQDALRKRMQSRYNNSRDWSTEDSKQSQNELSKDTNEAEGIPQVQTATNVKAVDQESQNELSKDTNEAEGIPQVQTANNVKAVDQEEIDEVPVPV